MVIKLSGDFRASLRALVLLLTFINIINMASFTTAAVLIDGVEFLDEMISTIE